MCDRQFVRAEVAERQVERGYSVNDAALLRLETLLLLDDALLLLLDVDALLLLLPDDCDAVLDFFWRLLPANPIARFEARLLPGLKLGKASFRSEPMVSRNESRNESRDESRALLVSDRSECRPEIRLFEPGPLELKGLSMRVVLVVSPVLSIRVLVGLLSRCVVLVVLLLRSIV